MAVGKGSMARAAKAAGQDGKATEQAASIKTAESAQSATAGKKASAGKAKKASVSAKKTSEKTVAAAETIAAPTEEVLQQIVYQKSDGMLERDAAPNEIFGLGDAMPVYYF